MNRNNDYLLYNAKMFNTVRDLLKYCNEKYEHKIAYAFERDGVLIEKKYTEFYNEVNLIGTKLFSLFKNKNKIAILSDNSYEWLVCYFGIVCSGNIVVPIDKDLPKESIEYIIKNTNSELLFYDGNHKNVASEILKENKISIIDMENINEFAKQDKISYEQILKEYFNIKIEADDIATIIYTSGTTGFAKGVVLSNKNLCADTCKSSKNLLLPGDSVLVLPLHHTFAFTANILCMLNIGYKVYINSSLKKVSKDMIKYKPKVMFVVPMMVEAFYKKIWASAKESKKDKILKVLIKVSDALLSIGIDVRRKLFKSVLQGFGGELEMIISGGAALDPLYVKAFRSIGINLLNGYGITECSPIVSVNRNNYYKDGSVGQILEDIKVKIDNPNNEGLGEILVKGDIVMQGYYRNDEKTNEAMDGDGYFRTGDIGYIDDKNFLYITGRIKNIIILDNGKNIYPEELEFYLAKYEGVKEVIIYEKNKTIMAEIYPDYNYLKEKNIKGYFEEIFKQYNKKQPSYKQINDYVLRDVEFEKTTTKKIKRKY